MSPQSKQSPLRQSIIKAGVFVQILVLYFSSYCIVWLSYNRTGYTIAVHVLVCLTSRPTHFVWTSPCHFMDTLYVSFHPNALTPEEVSKVLQFLYQLNVNVQCYQFFGIMHTTMLGRAKSLYKTTFIFFPKLSNYRYHTALSLNYFYFGLNIHNIKKQCKIKVTDLNELHAAWNFF